MRFDRGSLWDVIAVIATAIGVAGCANTCFVGFVNNGKAAVTVKTGDALSSCPPAQARGAIHVVALKSAVCTYCTVNARVEHVFVTLKSIQLRANAPGGEAPKDWLEIAPDLATQPRQIDLLGNPAPETLAQNATAPADSYDEMRLGFCRDASTASGECEAAIACGPTLRNCVITADLQIQPLDWPGGKPELMIYLRNVQGDSLTVLPDHITHLQLSLLLQRGFGVSSSGEARLRNVLTGLDIVVPTWSGE